MKSSKYWKYFKKDIRKFARVGNTVSKKKARKIAKLYYPFLSKKSQNEIANEIVRESKM